MSTLTAADVEKLVNERLHARLVKMPNVNAHVLPGTHQAENLFWYVPVGTDQEPPRKFEYYDVLAEVEDELQQEKHLNVLIVPSGAVPAPRR
jgi:hypothetical protein